MKSDFETDFPKIVMGSEFPDSLNKSVISDLPAE